jgi:membrane protease YdiL (CAAX protease family)
MATAEPIAERSEHVPGLWSRLPVTVRAVIAGLLVCLPAANVLPALALGIGTASAVAMMLAAGLEIAFLAAFLWWTRGNEPPLSTRAARTAASRAGSLSLRQWLWALAAAVAFAVAIHAAMVVTFRLVPFPLDAFRRGYDIARIPSLPLKWLVILLAAASAGITEETGFRGYMQQPIERRHGAFLAIAVSTLFFQLAHLNQGWAVPAMLPVGILIAGLLGLLAWASGSLVPGIFAHTLMDIGLFAYWWTGIVGTFTARTIAETGIDRPFAIACAVFAASLLFVLVSARGLWLLRQR